MARGSIRSLLVLAFAAAALTAALALPLPASSSRAHAADVAPATLDQGVLSELNAIRVVHGLVPLTESADLDRSAAVHSEEMAGRGYFRHASADGTVFWKRIEQSYASSGYGFWSVGENLLWSSPDVDAGGALRMWMSSPEHRANILAPRWREVGISAVRAPSAPGAYGGRTVVIVTTDFGVRR